MSITTCNPKPLLANISMLLWILVKYPPLVPSNSFFLNINYYEFKISQSESEIFIHTGFKSLGLIYNTVNCSYDTAFNILN